MANQKIRQHTQVSKSTTYTDTVAPSLANYQTNPANLEDDLNNLRSMLARISNGQTGRWYDSPVSDISAIDARSPIFTGTVNVFVDGTSGNDANNGLTSGTALQTIEAVYRKFPNSLFGSAQILVNLLNASTTVRLDYSVAVINIFGGNMPFTNTYAYRGPAMIQYVPATGPSTAALDVTPAVRVDQAGAGSATGQRTRFDFTVANPGWTVNDLASSFLRITRAGSDVIYEMPIVENTANSVTVDSINLVGVVLASDLVEIVTPSVRLLGSTMVVGVPRLAIYGRGSAQASINSITPYAVFERITFGGNFYAIGQGVLSFDRCQFEHQGGGASSNEIREFCIALANCSSQTGLILLTAQGSLAPTRRNTNGTPVAPTAIVDFVMAPKPGQSSPGLQIGSSRFSLTPRGAGIYTPVANLSVYRQSSHGIVVVGSGSLLMTSANATMIQGAGNGGAGLKCGWGGQARIPVNSVITTVGDRTSITGAAGSLAVHSGAVVPYGTGAGAFAEAAGFNNTLYRGQTTPFDQSRITTDAISLG